MSEPEQAERAWCFYIHDMIAFAERVRSYTAGMDQAGFVADRLVYDATLRNLELIGEAATHVPDRIRSSYQEVPWRLMIATRNRLIHGYLGIDDDIVWSIVTDDIPAILPALRALAGESQ